MCLCVMHNQYVYLHMSVRQVRCQLVQTEHKQNMCFCLRSTLDYYHIHTSTESSIVALTIFYVKLWIVSFLVAELSFHSDSTKIDIFQHMNGGVQANG